VDLTEKYTFSARLYKLAQNLYCIVRQTWLNDNEFFTANNLTDVRLQLSEIIGIMCSENKTLLKKFK